MQKVRWGVLGATSRVAQEAMIPSFRNSATAEIVAVASRSLESAQEIAAKIGPATRAYGDYDSLIADHTVDVVYVPLPNSLHVGWSIEAMNNGKHVLCEQPLAMNSNEAEEMYRTAEENGVILTEAFMYAYHPLQDAIAQSLAKGEIGEPRLVRASFSFVQTQSEDHRRDRSMGGGALFDIGCYCVHIARQAYGLEPISASGHSIIDPETQIDTTTTAQLQFPGGQTAVLDCSFSTTFRACYEIVGTEGYLTVPRFFLENDEPGQYILTRGKEAPLTRQSAAADMYLAEIDAMSMRARGEENFLLPASDGVANMRVLDTIAEAARTGQITRVGE